MRILCFALETEGSEPFLDAFFVRKGVSKTGHVSVRLLNFVRCSPGRT